MKTPKNSPIAVLYAAAREIVESTRQVFERNGQDAREIRLPILMHGTDMRVTIEAGPKVAARNVVEHAQMEANGRPAEPVVDISKTIQEAQTLLGLFAADLNAENCKTASGDADWHRTKAYADRCRKAIVGLTEVGRLL